MLRPEELERLALRSARNSLDGDKSDWIRLWAMARRAQGLSYEAEDWREAFRGGQQLQSRV